MFKSKKRKGFLEDYLVFKKDIYKYSSLLKKVRAIEANKIEMSLNIISKAPKLRIIIESKVIEDKIDA